MRESRGGGGGGRGVAPGVEVGEQRGVPGGRGHGAVADDVAARLGEGQHEGDEEDGGHDGQEPEDGLPAEELGQEAAEHGADGGADHGAGHRVAHVGAALGGARDVGDDAVGERDGAAAAGALQAAQHEQGGVVALQGEADVGGDVDGEAEQVGGAAAGHVGEVAEDGGGEALEDHVRGQGEVDHLAGDAQLGGKRVERGEVDVGGERGEEAGPRGHEDDVLLLPLAEDGVDGAVAGRAPGGFEVGDGGGGRIVAVVWRRIFVAYCFAGCVLRVCG